MRAEGHAELVLVGGTIYTMDPLRPRAEAVAVKGGRIEAVGDAATIRRMIGKDTRVVELGGRAVSAGLVDGHCHLYGLGLSLEVISLRGAASVHDARLAVKEQMGRFGEDEWIVGRGWDQNLWSPPEFPTAKDLDEVGIGRPAMLRRIDGHAAWLNRAALEAAGITRDTKDPPGGKIVRDAKGEPTGVLVDAAMDLVDAVIPPASPAARKRRILVAAKVAVEHGLTGVHEMGIDDVTVQAYRELVASGELPLRVYAYLDGSLLPTLPARKPDHDADGTSMFVVRGIKLFADGALGSRGAWLLQPYSDDPGNTGLVITKAEDLRAAVELTAKHGWQLAVHAIGDAANRAVLDAVEAGVGEAAARRAMRARIEHAQIVAPADVGRFAELGVLASMQPTHATSDMPWAGERLGEERLRGAYAWRSLLDAKARIVGGSDFPIEEVPPLLAFYSSITRQDHQGKPEGGWLPEQRLTLEEALRIFTVEPAYAAFAEGRRGVVSPGSVADLTVFDRDLVADGPGLLATKIDLTIVGGRIVYDRPR